jgi:hypothetical protein
VPDLCSWISIRFSGWRRDKARRNRRQLRPNGRIRLFSSGSRGQAQALLGNLREVIGELTFLDYKKMIAIGFDQSQVAKSLHEEADPRPCRADHLG